MLIRHWRRCDLHFRRKGTERLPSYVHKLQKSWLKCSKNNVKFWLNFQSIMTQRAISINISPNFYRVKIDWNLSIYCVCIESIIYQFNQKWLKFCILSQYWVNSEINQKCLWGEQHFCWDNGVWHVWCFQSLDNQKVGYNYREQLRDNKYLRHHRNLIQNAN